MLMCRTAPMIGSDRLRHKVWCRHVYQHYYIALMFARTKVGRMLIKKVLQHRAGCMSISDHWIHSLVCHIVLLQASGWQTDGLILCDAALVGFYCCQYGAARFACLKSASHPFVGVGCAHEPSALCPHHLTHQCPMLCTMALSPAGGLAHAALLESIHAGRPAVSTADPMCGLQTCP